MLGIVLPIIPLTTPTALLPKINRPLLDQEPLYRAAGPPLPPVKGIHYVDKSDENQSDGTEQHGMILKKHIRESGVLQFLQSLQSAKLLDSVA